ncbi:MAG: MarR family transcriptional regulator [Calditrichaeota bacterium]|nr:MAG: MarR family transcriptional regulator [Calditrichota bacterium]
MNHTATKSLELQHFFNKLNSSFAASDNSILHKFKSFSRHDLNIIVFLGLHGATKMQDLAHVQAMPMSTLTGVIDRLIEKSAIVRDRSEKDKRIIKVSLTPEGISLFQAVQEQRLILTENLMGLLKPEEQDILLLLSRKMRKYWAVE